MTESDSALVAGARSDVSSSTRHVRLEMMPRTRPRPHTSHLINRVAEVSDSNVG